MPVSFFSFKKTEPSPEAEELRHQLNTLNARLHCLRELAELDATQGGLRTFFDTVFEKLDTIFNYLAAGVLLFEYGTDKHLEHFLVGNNRFNVEDLLSRTLPFRMSGDLNTGRPVYFPDLSQRIPSFPLNTYSRSQLCLPLRSANKLMGVMLIESDQLDAFDTSLQEFLAVFAAIVAGSIQTHLLRYELDEKQTLLLKRGEWIAALVDLFQLVDQPAYNLTQLFERAISIIQRGLEFKEIVLALRNFEQDRYEIQLHTLPSPTQPLPVDRITRLMEEGFRVGRFSTLGYAEGLADPLSLGKEQPAGVILTPFRNFEGKITGFIYVFGNFERGLPPRHKIQMLEILASLLARSSETHRINREIEAIRSDYMRMQQEIALKQDELNQMESNVSSREVTIGDLQRDLDTREQRIKRLQEELAEKEAQLYAAKSFQPSHLSLENEIFSEDEEFDLLNLYNLSLILNSTMNTDDILAIIAEHTIQITHTQACKITVLKPESNEYRTTVSFGVASQFNTADSPEMTPDDITQWVIAHKKMLVIPDVAADATFRETALVQKKGVAAVIAIPMLIGDEIIGVLEAYAYEPCHFSESNIRLLSVLATQTAISINNSQLLQEKQRLAVVDELTGVYNYRYFQEAIGREIESHQNYPFSLLMIDVDNLKMFNDSFGHLYGSEALKLVAKTILRHVSPQDIVAKYGGDEFAVILMKTSKQDAFTIAERIRQDVEHTGFLNGENRYDGHITLSIGVAECPGDAQAQNQLFNAADQALYRAKNQGRNTSAF